MCLTEIVSKLKKIKRFTPRLTLILIGLVVAIVIIFKNGMFATAGNPKDTITSTSQVSVIVPNGGEKFVQGSQNQIQWKGGKTSVAIGLTKPEANNTFDIASAGLIIGWINTNEGQGYHLPNSSFTWNGLQVCEMSGDPGPDTGCKPVSPGNYKILVWSESDYGSKSIGSGSGRFGKYTKNDIRGNWDVSDQAFTISSQ